MLKKIKDLMNEMGYPTREYDTIKTGELTFNNCLEVRYLRNATIILTIDIYGDIIAYDLNGDCFVDVILEKSEFAIMFKLGQLFEELRRGKI